MKTSKWLWPALSETVNWQTGRINERRQKGAPNEKESKGHFLSHNIMHSRDWAVYINKGNKGIRENTRTNCVLKWLFENLSGSRFGLRD